MLAKAVCTNDEYTGNLCFIVNGCYQALFFPLLISGVVRTVKSEQEVSLPFHFYLL